MREGIAFGGNLIVDHIRKIDRLPRRSELAAIRGVGRSTGGACNNAIGMRKLDPHSKMQPKPRTSRRLRRVRQTSGKAAAATV